MGESAYRLNALKFKSLNIAFILEFRRVPLLQISGNSGSGKSLLVETLGNYLGKIEHFGSREDWLIISVTQRDGLKRIKDGTYKDYRLVVIDNADLLVDDEIQDIIYDDIMNSGLKTYWILLGRKTYGCIGSTLALCSLKRAYAEDKKLWIIQNDFEISKRFRQIPLLPGMSEEG